MKMKTIRLLEIITILFFFETQLKKCETSKILNFAASTESLASSLKTMSDSLFGDEKSKDEIDIFISIINRRVESNFNRVLAILKTSFNDDSDLEPYLILKEHIVEIGRIFRESATMKKNVDVHEIDSNNRRIEIFRKMNEKRIDEDLTKSLNMMMSNTFRDHLQKSFDTVSKIYGNVCKLGMSHLQFLDTVVETFKLATVQYYYAKTLIFDLLEIIGHGNFSISKDFLLQDLNLKYQMGVRNLKNIMATASRELWSCDSDCCSKAIRPFSNYIISEKNSIDPIGVCAKTRCQNIKRLNRCHETDEICRATRGCPGELYDCTQITSGVLFNSVKAKVCVKSDSNDFIRYYSIISSKETEDNFQCTHGESLKAKSTITNSNLFHMGLCHYCNCICQEQKYYVSLLPALADIDRNKVITGARLTVEDHILYIQIQDGMLLPNGTIDRNTIQWKDVNKSDMKLEISWNGVREIDLSEIDDNEDRVITGMGFSQKRSSNRINLQIQSSQFDYRTGQLKGHSQRTVKIASKQFNMTNQNLPMRTTETKIPLSTDDQYVKFTTSSLSKDGGQSTLPIIDTQKLMTNPPTPLSGAQLFIRGVEGFGGHLAIKLYTYDIRKYVDDQS